MSATRLGPRDMLEYDARYRVLICRECRYAIQKNAIQSHLLRHKIYRTERQILLSSIAKFDLLEPNEVPLPSPSSRSIDALPILSGYRCRAEGCGNLCVSWKRMRRHWTETHRLNESSDLSSLVDSVSLQTFFRGTRLRYFEVTTSSPAVGTVTTASDGKNYDGGNEVQVAAQLGLPVPPPLSSSGRSSQSEVDLETLTYFYHFTTTASLTLPGARNYWETEVVLQALHRKWLMCGLLAISAYHLAALTEDRTNEEVHRRRAAQFLAEFSTGWEEITDSDMDLSDAKIACGHIKRLLHCAHWGFTEFSLNEWFISDPAPPNPLQSTLMVIRRLVVLDFDIHPDNYQDNHHQEGTVAGARRILATWRSSDTEAFSASSSPNSTRSALLNRLELLPSRMAEVFKKPEKVQDFLAHISAIAMLVKCCDAGLVSDDVGIAWHSMKRWLIEVPAHFHDMVSRNDPASLVILAHWAASLVQNVERCGCWFFRGAVKIITQQVIEQIGEQDSAVQQLVSSAMS